MIFKKSRIVYSMLKVNHKYSWKNCMGMHSSILEIFKITRKMHHMFVAAILDLICHINTYSMLKNNMGYLKLSKAHLTSLLLLEICFRLIVILRLI